MTQPVEYSNTSLNGYFFHKLIGQGQYGTVYSCTHEETGTNYAVKITPKSAIKKIPKLQQLVNAEIKILKAIRNPNVVAYFDNWEDQNSVFLVIEFCNGGDLGEYLKTHKIIGQEQATEFLKEILNGFKGLHEVRAMHRDFKIQNVLLNNGSCKIGDFGFAKQLQKNALASTRLGSCYNMAPQIASSNKYGPQADIWSIGVVFYQMLHGTYPFMGRNQADLFENARTNPVKFNNPNISQKAKDFMKRCLTVDPKQRISWVEVYQHQLIKEDLNKSMLVFGNLESRVNLQENEEYYQNNSVQIEKIEQTKENNGSNMELQEPQEELKKSQKISLIKSDIPQNESFSFKYKSNQQNQQQQSNLHASLLHEEPQKQEQNNLYDSLLHEEESQNYQNYSILNRSELKRDIRHKKQKHEFEMEEEPRQIQLQIQQISNNSANFQPEKQQNHSKVINPEKPIISNQVKPQPSPKRGWSYVQVIQELNYKSKEQAKKQEEDQNSHKFNKKEEIPYESTIIHQKPSNIRYFQQNQPKYFKKIQQQEKKPKIENKKSWNNSSKLETRVKPIPKAEQIHKNSRINMKKQSTVYIKYYLDIYEKSYLQLHNKILIPTIYIYERMKEVKSLKVNHDLTKFILSKDAYHKMKTLLGDLIQGTKRKQIKTDVCWQQFLESQHRERLIKFLKDATRKLQAETLNILPKIQQEIESLSQTYQNQLHYDCILNANWPGLVFDTIDSYFFELALQLKDVERTKPQLFTKYLKLLYCLRSFNAGDMSAEAMDRRLIAFDNRAEKRKIEISVQTRLRSFR